MSRRIEPDVYRHLHHTADLVKEANKDVFGYEMAYACRDLSSPIEQMLLISLMAIKETEYKYSSFTIQPQFKIGRFAVDFLLSAGDMRLAVECDGHEFHDKTKQQREYEKQRERKILKDGFKIIRFTGSEIYRNPLVCASEALSILYGCHRERQIGGALLDAMGFKT